MIRDTHIQTLRELVEQAERDLAGYRRILDRAEQEQRVGMILPDPLAGPRPGEQLAPPWPVPEVVPAGRPPYADGPLFDGGTLPPKQENALGLIASEHDAYASTPKAHKEDEKWRQA